MSITARRPLWAGAALVAVLSLDAAPASAAPSAVAPLRFEIPSKELSSALRQFALQADAQIIFPDAAGMRVHGRRVSGDFTPDQALRRLLGGTPFTYDRLPSGVIRVFRASGAQAKIANPVRAAPAAAGGAPPSFSASMSKAPRAASALASGNYGAGETVDEIVVTGSRLASGLTAPTPVATVSSEAISNRASSQIIESLFDIPAFKQDAGVTQGQRSLGITAAVNLRGLGSTRSLTLVNGRRQVGTPAQAFDTNRIPSNMVERVEVVTGGASAAYGSDAVAGVVNFIINDRLDGIRTNAQYSTTDQGDNEGYNLSFAFGRWFARGRGNFIFGTEYAQANGTGNIYSRLWGRKEPGQVSPSAAQRAAQDLPANIFTNGVEFLSQGTNYGIIISGPLAGTAFNANGATYAFPVGQQIGAPGAGQALTSLQVGSTANFGNTTLGTFYLAMPLRRSASMVRATYAITDNVTAFGDLSYAYIKNNSVTGNQIPTGIVIQGANPFLPAPTRNALIGAGGTEFSLGIVPVKAVGNDDGNTAYQNRNRQYTLQTNVGLRGTLGDTWSWDLTWSRGWYHNVNSYENTLHMPNFAAATYVVAGANGQPTCGPVATNPSLNANSRPLVDPGCVPFDLFGAPSQAALDYVRKQTRASTKNKQDNVAINLSGSLVELWAGPLQLAVGAEYRKDKLVLTNEGFDSRAFGFGGSTPYAGEREVKEGYVEIGLPLVRDIAFANSIDLNGAVRRTDYEFSGAVTTYKVGATWDVNDSIRFRATQSRDIRAPNLTELFQLGSQTTTQGVRNPFNGQVGALLSRGSGNPDLTPEVAQTFTGGAVLRPTWSWASRFTLTTDYYWIKLKGAIASVNPSQTLERCFNGIASYCDAITFDNSSYGVATVLTRQFNQNQLRAKGVDFEVAYRAPIEDLNIGRLNIRASGGYQPTLTTIDTGGVSVNSAGTGIGVLKWRWVLNFDYGVGRFTGQLQANYFNKTLASPNLIGPDDSRYSAIKTTSGSTVNKNLFPAMVYWNLMAQYQVNDSVQVYGNINNLLDKQPPDLAMIAFTGIGGQYNPYDPVGRAFRVGVRGSF